MSTQQAFSKQIKQYASSLGFDVCGIARVQNIDPHNTYLNWLSQKFHASMHWLEKTAHIRLDITQKLPGAKSVIIVAKNYFTPGPKLNSTSFLRISRYAWGTDYHKVLKTPLKKLANFIRTICNNAETLCYVDTGPVLEKYWAALAGVGWIGKHSLIIHPRFGSWLFLGVLITTVELEPDLPLSDRCGNCRLCIESCPTGALSIERTLNAKKCISYQTIELKEKIDEEFTKSLGPWIFGCDICQEVCPWNQNPIITNESAFYPRPGLAYPNPDSLLHLTPSEFKIKFHNTSIERIGFEKFMDNIQTALKNLKKHI